MQIKTLCWWVCYVNSPPPSQSTENIVIYENPDIQQYDGNVSIISESENNPRKDKDNKDTSCQARPGWISPIDQEQ